MEANMDWPAGYESDEELSPSSHERQPRPTSSENEPRRRGKNKEKRKANKRAAMAAATKVPWPPSDSLNAIFDKDKTALLTELTQTEPDRSRAGSLDAEILPFVESINRLPDFYTTSSCAGRSLVFFKAADDKYQVDWLYLTHNVQCEAAEVARAVDAHVQQNLKGEVWFKMEPPIVAIRTRNVASAARLLDVAKGAGLKNCGARSISRSDGSVMVTLVDTHRIEAIVAHNGSMVCSGDYLALLARLATEKLQLSRDRFEVLRNAIEKAFESSPKELRECSNE